MNNPQLDFFNTIHLKSNDLKEAKAKCLNQEDRIMELMSKSGQPMTPFGLLEKYNSLYPPVPITSIRRALTCLTDKGKLVKLPDMVRERYGKPNYKWRIA